MKRFPFAAVTRRGFLMSAGLGILVGVDALWAQEPDDQLKELAVTPKAGEWLICVTSYTGPQAAELAEGLCQEIRRTSKLPCYVFNRGEDERRKFRDHMERQRQEMIQALKDRGLEPDIPVRTKTMRIQPEYAVLVGGYKDMDTASRNLAAIRRHKAPSERFMSQVTQVDQGQGKLVERKHINPFLTAFVVHNPTVPMKKDPLDKADPILKDLNAHEEFSLLKNKKPWTLMVKNYQGPAVLETSTSSEGIFAKVGLGKNAADVLTASGRQAHQVANLLRVNKLDAYVLHTRFASVVTVGGFDSADDPQLRALQAKLANCQLRMEGSTVVVEQLSPNPQPMAVPRP